MKKGNNHKAKNNKALVPLTGNLPAGVTQEEVEKSLLGDMKRTGEDVVPQLPLVKILHAGAQMFELPPDETGKSKKVEEFEGVIIDKHRCNAWWEKPFSETGGGVPPNCASLDARHGIVNGGDTIECVTCPYNQFGSAVDPQTGEKAKGKACKNMMRLHIMVEGDELPWRLSLSPANLKVADEFFSRLISKKVPMTAIKIRFSLESASSFQGIEYSQIKFEQVEKISMEEYWKNKEFLKLYLTQIRGQAIGAEEYDTTNGKKEEVSDLNGKRPIKEVPEGDIEDLLS